MKIISLWEPWASLVAIGAKGFETRSWTTNYRGPLLIHAAKMQSPEGKEVHREAIEDLGLVLPDWKDLPFGKILCRVHLFHTTEAGYMGKQLEAEAEHLTRFLRHTGKQEMAFGDYSEGRFVWCMEKVQQLKEPLAVRGNQGMRDYHDPPIPEDAFLPELITPPMGY